MLEEWIAAIDNVLYSPAMIGAQVFSVFLSMGLIVLYWRMLRETGEVSRPLNEIFFSFLSPKKIEIDAEGLFEKWSQIETRFGAYDEGQWKLGIIEADTVLDEAIKQLGFKGDTMGERMRKVQKDKFPFIDGAWRVHRVRNYLVHDPTYHLSPESATRTYEIYRNVFTQLGIIKREGD